MVRKYLDKINDPSDLRKLSFQERLELTKELRNYTIETVSKTGGHLASNLGIVELTVALHKVFDTPKDKIIWDVGHQVYIHKMLTGRKDQMDTLRKFGGVAGFPKMSESEYDVINTGHSSTSISAALGIARARDILKEDYEVVAVIGDGSLTGGMALEALNDAGVSKTNLIIVLNDNEMSISPNSGGLANALSKMRTRKGYTNSNKNIRKFFLKIPFIGIPIVKLTHKIKYSIKSVILPNMYFEDLGFKYLGPVDGNNLEDIEAMLRNAKDLEGPVLIHCNTVKGKGYAPAEKNPDRYHGVSGFDINTGETPKVTTKDYSAAFGDIVCDLAKEDPRIVTITAAMCLGTGLKRFRDEYPSRFFDVEIAEQHATTLAAGLAKGGCVPVVPIYSSFMQRAYDQLIHDVCMQNLHVVICLDRAGIVGADGETHQGIYDLAYSRVVPNLEILAPKNYTELRAMLYYATQVATGPVMIRYPRGNENPTLFNESYDDCYARILAKKAEVLNVGQDIMLCAIGKMNERALEVSEILKKHNINPTIINCSSLKPLDVETIKANLNGIKHIFTLEDGVKHGGLYSQILEDFKDDVKIDGYGYPDKFIEHGSIKELEALCKLDAESIANDILNTLK